MIEKCFDEGTIQAFLDGELNADLLERVARHAASCENCALLLQAAESESALAFSALDAEFNTLVPSERIRTKVYDAIAQIEKPRRSFLQKIFGGFSFSNPSIVSFASLILVVGLFAILWSYRQSPNIQVARNDKFNSAQTSQTTFPVKQPAEISQTATKPNLVSNPSAVAKPFKAAYKPKAENRIEYLTVYYKPKTHSERYRQLPITNTETVDSNENLPGEESYIKTIATLTQTVNKRKDEVLRPSAQVTFEKDLAVVDDAIEKMRREVHNNPKNEAAKQVLRASYQNKIDLLNSVADRTELVAMK
jgi:hypothetical protein